MGVTALAEAGTYGPETFHAFMDEYYSQSAIPLYAFLNVRKNGIQVSNILFNSVPGVEGISPYTYYTTEINGISLRFTAHSSNIPVRLILGLDDWEATAWNAVPRLSTPLSQESTVDCLAKRKSGP